MTKQKSDNAPELWWRWSPASDVPEVVKVVRHTDSCVWLAPPTGYDIPPRREKRTTDWYIIAPTRLECLQFAVRYEEEVATAAASKAKYYSDVCARSTDRAELMRGRVAVEKVKPTTPVEPAPPPKITDDMV